MSISFNTEIMKKLRGNKRKLDRVNYNAILFNNMFDDNNEECSYIYNPYDISEAIESDIKYILEQISVYNGYKTNTPINLGVISSGAHSLDFANYYGFDIDDTWNFKPVMFIYECPGNNLDASFLEGQGVELIRNYERISKNIEDNVDKLLCNRIWHADSGKENYINNRDNYGSCNYAFFEKQKVYSEFLLSLILEFKLANLYTTNFFRYEIFQIETDDNGNRYDNAFNLSGIHDLKDLNNKEAKKRLFNYIPNVFMQELKTFEPSVIFSTSVPLKYIEKIYNNPENNFEKNPTIMPVPHPAYYSLGNKKRFMQNTFNIFSGLIRGGVINKKTEIDGFTIKEKWYRALQKYEEM